MYISFNQINKGAPEERNVYAKHMSLLKERKGNFLVEAINILLLRSKAKT